MVQSNTALSTWRAATSLLHDDGKLSDAQLAFLKLVYPLNISGETFTVAVASDFVKNWVIKNVLPEVAPLLSTILARDIHIDVMVDASYGESEQEEEDEAPIESIPAPTTHEQHFSREDHANLAAHGGHKYVVNHENVTETFPQPEYSPEQPSAFTPSTSAPSTNAHSSSAHSSHSSQGREATHENYYREAAPHVDEFSKYDLRSPLEMLGGEEDRFVSSIPEEELRRRQEDSHINANYTFDNFVVGESNRFAYAAAIALAEQPDSNYSPLFLYSNSGMGKTHLMHAIGNAALVLHPASRVYYVSAETFMTDFIYAMRERKQNEFKERFRNVDILLIDDIQFLGKSDTTVEEFFHTFNALTTANKQIVITSDVAPKYLSGFEERMLSRFNSGVTVSIDTPSLETRIAILQKTAELEGIDVPHDVHEFIASHITSNIREMEGALRTVSYYAALQKQPPTVALCELVLKDIIMNPENVEITPSVILTQICHYYDVTLDDLTSGDRSRAVVNARQAAMYLCRVMTELSLPRIGELFGGRDHTTVMHAYRKVSKLIEEKKQISSEIEELKSRIHQEASKAS